MLIRHFIQRQTGVIKRSAVLQTTAHQTKIFLARPAAEGNGVMLAWSPSGKESQSFTAFLESQNLFGKTFLFLKPISTQQRKGEAFWTSQIPTSPAGVISELEGEDFFLTLKVTSEY